MRFNPFRGLRRDERPDPAAGEPTGSIADEALAPDDQDDDPDRHGGPPEALDEPDDALAWRDRAGAVIPGGTSTGSKRPEALYGTDEPAGPTHYTAAAGCRLTTVSGGTVVDCTMALGAVALGYADDGVTRAVVGAAAGGNVAGLTHVLEVELAERLCDVIPCAEQVRFLKTGAEACAAAVRIARTYTGRAHVIGSGYFGWLDWWSDAAGVPPGARADFTAVPFNDVAALERAVDAAGGDLAAIMLEPVVERLPSAEWLAAARAACDRSGAVLVFDEIKTGFRVRTGGYQATGGVEPHLATFGKAMANGFPLSAVVGRAEVMDAARRTWISSTLASEATALAAARAVLDRHDAADVCAALAEAGAELRGAVERAVAASGVAGVRVLGLDPMWLLRWDDPRREARFVALALRHGALIKRGAYNFASLAHDERAVVAVERAASTALVELAVEGADEDAVDDGGTAAGGTDAAGRS